MIRKTRTLRRSQSVSQVDRATESIWRADSSKRTQDDTGTRTGGHKEPLRPRRPLSSLVDGVRQLRRRLTEQQLGGVERRIQRARANTAGGDISLGGGSLRRYPDRGSLVSETSASSDDSDYHRAVFPPPYRGPRVGRARARCDYQPSPYDRDALPFRCGDIIDIISKNPSGLWRGALLGRVGTFKFINVEVLEEVGGGQQPVSPLRERPATVCQLLEQLELSSYEYIFSLHGFDQVEDFLGLHSDQLRALGITDRDHRRRLLSAARALETTGPDFADDMDEDVICDYSQPLLSELIVDSDRFDLWKLSDALGCPNSADKPASTEEKQSKSITPTEFQDADNQSIDNTPEERSLLVENPVSKREGLMEGSSTPPTVPEATSTDKKDPMADASEPRERPHTTGEDAVEGESDLQCRVFSDGGLRAGCEEMQCDLNASPALENTNSSSHYSDIPVSEENTTLATPTHDRLSVDANVNCPPETSLNKSVTANDSSVTAHKTTEAIGNVTYADKVSAPAADICIDTTENPCTIFSTGTVTPTLVKSDMTLSDEVITSSSTNACTDTSKETAFPFWDFEAAPLENGELASAINFSAGFFLRRDNMYVEIPDGKACDISNCPEFVEDASIVSPRICTTSSLSTIDHFSKENNVYFPQQIVSAPSVETSGIISAETSTAPLVEESSNLSTEETTGSLVETCTTSGPQEIAPSLVKTTTPLSGETHIVLSVDTSTDLLVKANVTSDRETDTSVKVNSPHVINGPPGSLVEANSVCSEYAETSSSVKISPSSKHRNIHTLKKTPACNREWTSVSPPVKRKEHKSMTGAAAQLLNAEYTRLRKTKSDPSIGTNEAHSQDIGNVPIQPTGTVYCKKNIFPSQATVTHSAPCRSNGRTNTGISVKIDTYLAKTDRGHESQKTTKPTVMANTVHLTEALDASAFKSGSDSPPKKRVTSANMHIMPSNKITLSSFLNAAHRPSVRATGSPVVRTFAPQSLKKAADTASKSDSSASISTNKYPPVERSNALTVKDRISSLMVEGLTSSTTTNSVLQAKTNIALSTSTGVSLVKTGVVCFEKMESTSDALADATSSTSTGVSSMDKHVFSTQNNEAASDKNATIISPKASSASSNYLASNSRHKTDVTQTCPTSTASWRSYLPAHSSCPPVCVNLTTPLPSPPPPVSVKPAFEPSLSQLIPNKLTSYVLSSSDSGSVRSATPSPSSPPPAESKPAGCDRGVLFVLETAPPLRRVSLGSEDAFMAARSVFEAGRR